LAEKKKKGKNHGSRQRRKGKKEKLSGVLYDRKGPGHNDERKLREVYRTGNGKTNFSKKKEEK